MTSEEKPVCTKTRYKAERFALMDAQRIKKKKDGRKKPKTAYFCYCGYWHLSSRDNFEVTQKDKENESLKKEVDKLKATVEKLKVELAESKKISSAQKAKIKTDQRILEMQNERVRNHATIKKLKDEVFELLKEKHETK